MRSTTLFLLLSLVLGGCGVEPTSSRGFRLPDGDAEVGREVFARSQCVACHSVEGAELGVERVEGALNVRLGGKVNRVRTYGELVTAVVNPSHKLAPAYRNEVGGDDEDSPMPDYNATMTVQELIDLVAFLQSTYTEYLPDDYDPYFP